MIEKQKPLGALTAIGEQLVSVREEPPHSHIQDRGHKCHISSVESFLKPETALGARKGTEMLLCGPKSSFQMKVCFAPHLDVCFPNTSAAPQADWLHAMQQKTPRSSTGCISVG
ncbi:hypothetical protein XENOCAPTIV_002878 [Xenoophorus captivus]|uniref:Uncharacterized protein n=1 Tax=Xenoophorus captivus TaxID=1517983 RepID=A0ABV0S656_9TELE